MDHAEAFLLDFHRHHPGCTRVAFETGKCLEAGISSYELLSSLANDDSILDLGCGDGHLLSLLETGSLSSPPVGVDFSPNELAAARREHPHRVLAQAKAQRLPFATGSFSLVLSHFAFHLMSDLDVVVDELARVLTPSGRFATVIGGGPKVGDTFETFLDVLKRHTRPEKQVPSIGERRGRTEEGLSQLFGAHPAFRDQLEIRDHYVDFGGSFDEVWTRLSTVYDLMYFTSEELLEVRESFRKRLNDDRASHIPCTMAIRRVIAQRG
jgi:ubiquinone/menaquinone biosynthesis C-methylase UbiE